MPSGKIPATGEIVRSSGPLEIRFASTPTVVARPLTVGEILMAQSVFQGAIDYKKVKIHNGEYLWFGLQDDDTAMTPNGEIYFNPKHFKSDYSREDSRYKRWFIHEMTHVWQYQLGFGVKAAGIATNYRNKSVYRYDVVKDAGKKLGDFHFEQQGEIIADYFSAKLLGIDPFRKIAFLEGVLSDFLQDPSNAKLLPR